MPKPTKLALEMALHEEQERRALEGELWLLERAWEEAEEIAEISDNLFLPEGTEDFIRSTGSAPYDLVGAEPGVDSVFLFVRSADLAIRTQGKGIWMTIPPSL